MPGIESLTDMIRQWERGDHAPSERYRVLYSRITGKTVEELFPAPPQGPTTVLTGTVDISTTPDTGDEDDVKRRAALQLITTLGITAGTWGTEPFRHLLDLALTAEPRDLDEWHLACVDHLHALRTRPPVQAREDLVIDLLALGCQLQTSPPTADRIELRRVEAALAMLHAHLLTRLGDHGAAIRWWRTARAAADHTGDLDLRMMIRCEEAGIGLYGQREVGTVLTLVQSAERAAGDAPSFWKADLAGTRAKALTLLGRHDQAMEALNLYAGYGGPDSRGGIFPTLWVFDQVHFAQSWVYASAGNEAAADTARELVLSGPAGHRLGGASPYAVNVRLHEALCTIVNGGIDHGARQASTVLDQVPVSARTHLSTATGNMALEAVPSEQRDAPAVREFREVLAKTAPVPALTAAT
ncbi:hypothetical protein SMC26_08950 [Actinomadura fulvescens]|uniref:hypothetical protein n=1 Tax=Actinomadura fulvescens TaxID=46160 RepID=UPI00397BF99B